MQPHAADEQYSLANQYYDGKGLPQNLAEAGKLYRLAADQGHSMAQTRLGEMYEGGYGVSLDYGEAARLYRLAADQGEAAAEYDLGVMYKYGRGVPRDYAEALKWFSLADAKGYAAAATLKDEVSRYLTPDHGKEKIGTTRRGLSGERPRVTEPNTVSFAGKAEIVWLIFVGMVSLAALIASINQATPRAIVWATGAVACVFALPLALIVIAAILAIIVQIFTPGGGSVIPLFGWKGGVDGLSPAERREFQAKPCVVRFAKVYVWLAVNSLVGALIALAAFAAIYVLMQIAQQPKH